MNTVEKKRLIKLADFLQKLPRKKFYFGAVLGEQVDKLPNKKFDCGTTGCAIGWCPVIFPKLVRYELKAMPTSQVCLKDDNEHGRYYIEVAETMFGITDVEAHALFSPGEGIECDLKTLGENATPKQVAKNIRLFIKNKEKELA